jgi:membrane fusion protein (multidrug efflux system)
MHAAVLGCTILLASCDDASEVAAPTGAPPPSVTVETVSEREIVSEFVHVGRLEAFDQVEISARVQGYLQEILFTDGQNVEVGDLLFLIDSAPFQADVDLAKANVASASALLEQTRNQFERSQTLFDQGDVTTTRLEQDKSAYQQASAELLASQAKLRQAEIQLGYTSILAPISGRIGRANFSLGTLIETGSGPLAEITSLDPIYVTFAVSETNMLKVKQDRLDAGLDPAFDGAGGVESRVVPIIRLPNGTTYAETGVIDFVSPAVDIRTATFAVRAVFPNPNEFLSPGQFVTVVLSDKEPSLAITVPQVAVQQDKEGEFVLVVDSQNMVSEQRITTSGTDGTDFVVESGLAQGDTVIVQGILKVRPGVPVNPVQDTSGDG